jgi:NADPH:quinone reductase-like Zn-dependent oxidoreductase
VEIRVAAAAVNFRDVLYALGVLSNHNDTPVGSECAGTVVEVGEGVADIHRGDEVVALAAGSMASRVTVQKELVFPKLRGLSMEEAAAIPVVFLTAFYGLHRLAKIQAGERVLIHAAAGGVGQAAIQLAHKAGAEVFATASPAKWDFLKAAGERHVMNSRTLDFAEQVLALTEGQGVDVVLNCLNGEFIAKSFEALRRGGRFLEIGKIGIWDQERVRSVRPDAAYFVYDIAAEMARDLDGIREMLAQITNDMRQGRLRPPALRVFPITQARDAFHLMAAGKTHRQDRAGDGIRGPHAGARSATGVTERQFASPSRPPDRMPPARGSTGRLAARIGYRLTDDLDITRGTEGCFWKGPASGSTDGEKCTRT